MRIVSSLCCSCSYTHNVHFVCTTWGRAQQSSLRWLDHRFGKLSKTNFKRDIQNLKHGTKPGVRRAFSRMKNVRKHSISIHFVFRGPKNPLLRLSLPFPIFLCTLLYAFESWNLEQN